MNFEQKLTITESGEVGTLGDFIKAIKEIRAECTIESALGEIEYSIKHGILAWHDSEKYI